MHSVMCVCVCVMLLDVLEHANCAASAVMGMGLAKHRRDSDPSLTLGRGGEAFGGSMVCGVCGAACMVVA